MLIAIRRRFLVELITRRSCVRIAPPLYKIGLELITRGSLVPILFYSSQSQLTESSSRGLISPGLGVQISPRHWCKIMTNNSANRGKMLVTFLFVINGFTGGM